MSCLSEIESLHKELGPSLLDDLEWVCQVGDLDPASEEAPESEWYPWADLRGESWGKARFKVEIVVPRLLAGCRLRLIPVLGGRNLVSFDGNPPEELPQVVGIDTPVLESGSSLTIAIESREGWMSPENPAPARLDCDRCRLLRGLYQEISFILSLHRIEEARREVIEDCLSSFLSCVNQEALSRGDVGGFLSSLREARRSLGELDPVLKKYELHIVPHSHVDLAWGWTYEQTKRMMRTIFDRATDLMERYPEYTFAQDQPPTYSHLEGSELWNRISSYVEEGRIDPCGAMYSEPETNMPCGESLIRQVVLAKRYFSERFGVEPLGCWNLDSFSGHSFTLPQILKKCGVRYYTFANWGNLVPDVEFWWEGPDGSRVLAYHLPCHYDSAQLMEQDKILRSYAGYASRSSFKRFMLLDGDDLTPPSEASVEGVSWFNDLGCAPRIFFSTSRRFFEDLEGEDLGGIPVFRGELPQTLDPGGKNNVGCYTTHAESKTRNRRCECLLLTAERFGSVAALTGYEYPKLELKRAWERVLLNQMHDILPGTAIAEAYDEAHRRYDWAEDAASRAIDDSLKAISCSIDTNGPGIPIVVFNPLSWERTDLAEVVVTLEQSYRGYPRLLDSEGQEVECQIIEDTRGTYDKTNRNLRFIFLAESVPSLGYRTYHLQLGERPEARDHAKLDEGTMFLENEFLRAGIDTRTGLLESLEADGEQFLDSPGRGLLVHRIADRGDAWHTDTDRSVELTEAESVELVESGPVRKTIRVRRRSGGTRMVQDISVIRGVPRLNCRVAMDCSELDVMFKLGVKPDLGDYATTYEIPFASLERDAQLDRPAQNWTDLSDERRGLSLINDGRYAYDVEDGALRITLLRNVRGHLSSGGTDTGHHETSVALHPHHGNWESAVVRQGLEFNNPLIAHVDSVHEGVLPGSFSFLSLGAPSAVVSCLKLHEDSGDLVLRVYETEGSEIEDIGLSSEIEWDGVEEIDMCERTRIDSRPERLSPREIKTLRIRSPSLRPLAQ